MPLTPDARLPTRRLPSLEARSIARTLGVLLAVALAAPALAQPVPSREGTSTHIFPAGGQRGTRVSVRIGTECMPPRTELRLLGSGVTAPSHLELEARGGHEPSPRRKPTEVPVNYPREWESTFEIDANATPGTVHWRLFCASGGTSARPFVIGELPEHVETESNSRPERAEHVTLPVTINGRIAGERDADYFRFLLAEGEFVECAVAARRLGSPLDPVLTLAGPAGDRLDVAESYQGSDPVLRFRATRSGEHLLRIAHVGAAGGPQFVYRLTVQSVSGATDASAPGADTEEREPNESPENAQRLTVPATLIGRFAAARDEDWFAIAAATGERLTIRCAAPLGSAASPILEVQDGAGRSLSRHSAVERLGGPVEFEFRAPAAGDFRLRLVDLQHGAQGGPEFVYRLTAERARPGFSLSLKSDLILVTQGDKQTLDVSAARRGGFDGPIEVSLDGLPEGVACEPVTVAGTATSGTLTVSAAADACSQGATVRVVGRAMVDGVAVTQSAAAPHAGRDAEGGSLGPPEIDSLLLAVRHKPLFRLSCNEAYQYAHRGTVHPYLMDVERQSGFEGEVTLQLADRQNRDLDGVDMVELRIPAGHSQGRLPIHFPETMHINVQSQSQLYAQAYALFHDDRGRPQAVCVVSEKRNLVRTLPTVVKLLPAEPQLSAIPGSETPCRLLLQRTANCPGPLTVELVPADESAGVRAPPVEAPAGATEVAVLIRLPTDAPRGGRLPLVFRASGLLESGARVVSEARVLVVAQ